MFAGLTYYSYKTAASPTLSYWNNKGRVLYKLGKYEKAIECCDKALKIDPDFMEAWYNKGRALAELGKYEEAT
jgi:tetratricopeptide (TPR) repeat protein